MFGERSRKEEEQNVWGFIMVPDDHWKWAQILKYYNLSRRYSVRWTAKKDSLTNRGRLLWPVKCSFAEEHTGIAHLSCSSPLLGFQAFTVRMAGHLCASGLPRWRTRGMQLKKILVGELSFLFSEKWNKRLLWKKSSSVFSKYTRKWTWKSKAVMAESKDH